MNFEHSLIGAHKVIGSMNLGKLPNLLTRDVLCVRELSCDIRLPKWRPSCDVEIVGRIGPATRAD